MTTWRLIYDGDCGFCRRQIDLLDKLDKGDVIEFEPFQEADLARYGISTAEAQEAMQLVSPAGEVWEGAEAAREIFRLLPRTRPLAWLFKLPGVMFVAKRIYRFIARRRHRFGCESGVCQRGSL